MLLPAEIDINLEKKCCKKYAIRFFCSGGSKIVFVLLTEVIAGHVIIIPINVKKTCLEKMLTGVFCNRKSGFHYFSNDILYVFLE